jgi:hypothetical protein
MKKITLIIAVILSSTVLASAQFYIGGSLILYSESQGIKDLDNSTHPTNTFYISPEVGYILNEKMAIGLSVPMDISSSKSSNIGMDIDGNLRAEGINKTNSKRFEIAPYFRYSILKRGKFDLFGMASAYANTAKTELNLVYDYDYGYGSHHSESISNVKTFTWGLRICPVLMYNFSSRLSLLAYPNLLHSGFYQERVTRNYGFGENEYTTIRNVFDLRINTNNLIPSIGFIYKF